MEESSRVSRGSSDFDKVHSEKGKDVHPNKNEDFNDNTRGYC